MAGSLFSAFSRGTFAFTPCVGGAGGEAGGGPKSVLYHFARQPARAVPPVRPPARSFSRPSAIRYLLSVIAGTQQRAEGLRH